MWHPPGWPHNLYGLRYPQGGIASPIFFNIYLHEFDDFIKLSLSPNLKLQLTKQYKPNQATLSDRELTKEIKTVQMRLYRANTRYELYRQANNLEQAQIQLDLYNDNVKLEKQLKARKLAGQQQAHIQTQIKDLRMVYVRYADH